MDKSYKEAFQRLTEEYISRVKCCDECFAESFCIEQQRREVVAVNNSVIKDIEAKGIKITELTTEEKEMFQAVAKDTVYKTAAKEYGQELFDLAASYNK